MCIKNEWAAMILRMYHNGVPVEQISAMTSMNLEEVRDIVEK